MNENDKLCNEYVLIICNLSCVLKILYINQCPCRIENISIYTNLYLHFQAKLYFVIGLFCARTMLFDCIPHTPIHLDIRILRTLSL